MRSGHRVADEAEAFTWSAIVGTSRDDFARARSRLMNWSMHRDAGVDVLDAPERVVLGARARLRILVIGVVPIHAPVHVVEIVDESARAGFTYRALPGHPERGEEEFLLELLDDDRVRFTVRGRSAPALWWSRLGAPVTRRVQRRVIDRYLSAVLPPPS